MRIYICSDFKKNPATSKLLVRLVSEKGFQVLTNEEVIDPKKHEPKGWYAQHEAFHMLRGLILEITEITPQITYLLAQAMFMKKPLLCLYEKSKPPREFLMLIRKKHCPDFIIMKSYTLQKIEATLNPFLASLSSEVMQTVANIKFTLRISPKIEQYLQWKAKQEGMTKANYLRNLLLALQQEDREYRQWLGEDEPTVDS